MNVACQHPALLTVGSDEEAPQDFKEETWQGKGESHQAIDAPIHDGAGSERSGHRKRRRRPHQRNRQGDYDTEQQEQQEQQCAHIHQNPPQKYNLLPQYPPPQLCGWSTPLQQPYTQHAAPLPLHPLNFMSASMRYSESSQYAGYGPAPSPYAPFPTPYAQGPPIFQYPSSYAPAPSSYVQPNNPASTQPSNASIAYRGRPQGVKKSRKGPLQVPNPPGAKKRRKRLEAINNCLAKGKSELEDLEKQVSALKAWYQGLEGVKASLKKEVGADHEGGLVKTEEMEDEQLDLGGE